MITEEVGKWKSIRTSEEDAFLLMQKFKELNAEEREALKVILKENSKGNNYFLNFLKKLNYEYEPVDMETWLKDKYYFGEIGKDLYPKLREDLIDIVEGGYEEVAMSGSFGWGKTFISRILICRMFYESCCLRNPQEAYGIADDEDIVFVNVSVTKDLAKKVLFDKIGQMMRRSPFFMEEIKPKMVMDGITYIRKKIIVSPAASGEKDLLGQNIFGGIIDETNFRTKTLAMKQIASSVRGRIKDNASELYDSILRRRKSRFLKKGKLPGLLIIVSSKRDEDDFLQRKLRESSDTSTIKVLDYAKYELVPKNYAVRKFSVLVGNGRIPSRVLRDDENIDKLLADNDDIKVIRVPYDFKDDFDKDVNDSLRDIAGIAVRGISKYFSNKKVIGEAIDVGREHPGNFFEVVLERGDFEIDWNKLVRINKDGEREPIVNPTAERVAHIDLALNGCAIGLAIGHKYKDIDVVRRDSEGRNYIESAPYIYYDFILRILPEEGGEMLLSNARKIIYMFSEHGYRISKVTFDRFQSAESIQQMRLKGYESGIVSTVTSTDAYDALKSAFVEHRISMYNSVVVVKELIGLEIDRKKNKVVCPQAGTKDIADVVAGVAFNLTFGGYSDPLEPILGKSDYFDGKDRAEDFGFPFMMG